MRKLFPLLYILFTTVCVFSQDPATTGSLGFFHSQESRVLMPGRWNFWVNYNYYSKLGEYIGQPPADFQEETYSVAAGNFAASYGLIDHLDATLGLRVYQKTNYPNTANVPDDIFIKVKAGSFAFAYGHFDGALSSTILIPVGEVHNYPWAAYSSGAVEFGFTGSLSYYYNPYLPEQGIGFHFNAGWWSHNEKGKEVDVLGDTTYTATVSSSELRLMLSTSIPAGPFTFMFEFWGGIYTTIPDQFVYSAEDYAFITPSLRYKPLDMMSVDLGVDVRVSPDNRQRTSGVPDISSLLDLPKNYPPWRIQIGLTYSILPPGVHSQYGGGVDDPLIRRRLNFHQRVVEEKVKSDAIEEQIEEIRKTRENADADIDQIRYELEY
jgi:hypothetical protein